MKHAFQSAGGHIPRRLFDLEQAVGDLRGETVAVHGGTKSGSTCLTFACVRWINKAHRAYYGGHVVKSFFAADGDYDDVAVCRATRHLSDYLAIRYYLPRLSRLKRMFVERSAALKELVLGKVGKAVLDHWELFQFDCQAAAVVHHGYLHALFMAADSPDTFAAVIESCLAEIDQLLTDDAKIIAKFTAILHDLAVEIEVKEREWAAVKAKAASMKRLLGRDERKGVLATARTAVTAAAAPLVEAWPAAQKANRLARLRVFFQCIKDDLSEKLLDATVEGSVSLNMAICGIDYDNYDIEDWMRVFRLLLLMANNKSIEFAWAEMCVLYSIRRHPDGLFAFWSVPGLSELPAVLEDAPAKFFGTLRKRAALRRRHMRVSAIEKNELKNAKYLRMQREAQRKLDEANAAVRRANASVVAMPGGIIVTAAGLRRNANPGEMSTYVHRVTGTRADGYDRTVTLNVFALRALKQSQAEFVKLKPYYVKWGLFAEWSGEEIVQMTVMPSFCHVRKGTRGAAKDVAAGFDNGVLPAKHLLLYAAEAEAGYPAVRARNLDLGQLRQLAQTAALGAVQRISDADAKAAIETALQAGQAAASAARTTPAAAAAASSSASAVAQTPPPALRRSVASTAAASATATPAASPDETWSSSGSDEGEGFVSGSDDDF